MRGGSRGAGTTHLILEPLDFLARLTALVPPPRIHLTRYHGIFAPASALRGAITPAGRGRGARRKAEPTEPPIAKHVSMTWMQRLKRVFAIEIERCRRCGGKLKVIASIEDPALIERMLAHLERPTDDARRPFASRALRQIEIGAPVAELVAGSSPMLRAHAAAE